MSVLVGRVFLEFSPRVKPLCSQLLCGHRRNRGEASWPSPSECWSWVSGQMMSPKPTHFGALYLSIKALEVPPVLHQFHPLCSLSFRICADFLRCWSHTFLFSDTIRALFLSTSVFPVISVGPCKGCHVHVSSQPALLTSAKHFLSLWIVQLM